MKVPMIFSDQKARLHATIEGHVQGVGFRYFVMEKAQNLGLTGFVRNTWQGEVEVSAEGVREDLELLLEALRRGPGGAYVSRVDFKWSEATGEYQRFGIISTL